MSRLDNHRIYPFRYLILSGLITPAFFFMAALQPEWVFTIHDTYFVFHFYEVATLLALVFLFLGLLPLLFKNRTHKHIVRLLSTSSYLGGLLALITHAYIIFKSPFDESLRFLQVLFLAETFGYFILFTAFFLWIIYALYLLNKGNKVNVS